MVSIGENHTTEGETPSQPELLGHMNFTKVTFGPLQYSALFALRQSIEVCGSPGITLRLFTASVKFTYLGQRPKTPSVSYNSVLFPFSVPHSVNVFFAGQVFYRSYVL